MRLPPTQILEQAAKMPKRSHALFIIVNGEPLNAEFCVWGLDDYFDEIWQWKKRPHADLNGKHVEAWAKLGKEWKRINLNAV